MATPMTATEAVTQLKKWGLRYVEISGWATHNRNSKGAWGPVNGFIWHHTGADVKDAKAYAAGTLYNGLSDLPGPLCHFSIGADGTVYLIGWGRANHAGGGDPAVLQHVINEDYTGQLHPTRGNSDGVDGNAHFYGVEIQYSGSHEMSAAQYAAARRLSAAVLDFHGWTERSVIAHGEWSDDKWDPGYAPGKIMAMPAVRSDVASTLRAGPTQEEDPMAGITKADIYDAVWKTDQVAAPPDAPDAATNTTWQPQSYLKDTNTRLRELAKKVDTLTTPVVSDAQITALAAAVAANPALAEQIAEKVAAKLAARLAQ
jgi:hypothetical protein